MCGCVCSLKLKGGLIWGFICKKHTHKKKSCLFCGRRLCFVPELIPVGQKITKVIMWSYHLPFTPPREEKKKMEEEEEEGEEEEKKKKSV